MFKFQLKSTLTIFVFGFISFVVCLFAIQLNPINFDSNEKPTIPKEASSIITDLQYFKLKEEKPHLSLMAQEMEAFGEDRVTFVKPAGLYHNIGKEPIVYESEKANYDKSIDRLVLQGEVKFVQDDSTLHTDKLAVSPNKKFVEATGNVIFDGYDPKTRDHLILKSNEASAWVKEQIVEFRGKVDGKIMRQRKYELPIVFRSERANYEGLKSYLELNENVFFKRGEADISAGKAEIFLENQNKKLKYLVLSSDVKLTQIVHDKIKGPVTRKAYSEKLEGYGAENKVVMSGAPRVVQGADVIKGYKIILRENLNFVEVEDAMTDFHPERKKK